MRGDCKHIWLVGKKFSHHSCRNICNIRLRCKKCKTARYLRIDCISCYQKYKFCAFLWFGEPVRYDPGYTYNERKKLKERFLKLIETYETIKDDTLKFNFSRCMSSCGSNDMPGCHHWQDKSYHCAACLKPYKIYTVS